MNSTATTKDTVDPWYRHRWPWILISIPATSVILGIMMITLSLNTNNSLVVDDYYKEGKAINQQLERDRTASLLGISAVIEHATPDMIIQLEAALGSTTLQWPASLNLDWIHVAFAERDRSLVFTHAGGGRYVAVDAASLIPVEGRWRLQLEPVPNDANSNWRLTSQGSFDASKPRLTLHAPRS